MFLLLPTKLLENAATASDLYAQAKLEWERNSPNPSIDRTTAEFNVAVMELLQAKIALADAALADYEARAAVPHVVGTPLEVFRRLRVICPVCGTSGQ